MFTELEPAIEEARYLKRRKGHHRCILQLEGGRMVVRVHRKSMAGILMYTTRLDKEHTVLPEVR
ncbi:hypothetical protein Xekk_03735 [Xenorhabdus sp. KK7.4]|nr:hypothetical protein Xekk_04244 [Xenorhabdus sp. KK7.4]PHM51427.1 hypothetical protein Xekk_03735 [Xenorhabdus sp. KK7.4]